MDNNYNLPVTSETPTEDPGYNIPVAGDPTLPPEIASQRASKAAYGLAGKVPGDYNDYYQAFTTGQEDQARNIAVNKLRELDAQRQYDQIIRLQEQNQLDENTIPTPVWNDPRSVFEDHFAQQYMDKINWPVGKENSNWLQQAYEFIPELTRDTINLGTEYRAKAEFGQTRLEDAQTKAQDQSWLGWGVDLAKASSIIYNVLKTHPESRDEMIEHLWTVPYEEMKDEYDKYISTLNPGDARQFAADFMGIRDRFLETILPVTGIETGIVAGAISKQVLYNGVKKAVRDQASAAVASKFPELSAAVSSGDLATATKRRAWGDMIKRARRADPYADALEDLPNLFRISRERLATEQAENAAYGVETAGSQLLLDQYDQMIKTYPEMVSNLTRPETIPALAEGHAAAIEAAQQDVINRNKYFAPILVNTSKPYRVDPFTRSWFVDLIGGRNTQEAFGSSAEAGKQAARMGLDGFELVGDDVKHEPQLTGFDRTKAEMAASERFDTEAEARTRAESLGIKNYTIEGKPRSLGESLSHLEETTSTSFKVKSSHEAGDIHVVVPGKGKKVFEKGIGIWRSKDFDYPVRVLAGKVETNTFKGELTHWVPVEYEGKERFVNYDELVGKSEEKSIATPPGAKDETSGFKLNIKGLGPKARIEQSGTGWYIIKPVAVDETAPAMRQYAAALDSTRTPTGGILNSFMARLRTPNETLSSWMNKNREAATFASSVIEKYAYDQLEAIRKFAPSVKLNGVSSSQKWNEWERVMNAFQKLRDPVTGEIGYTPQTINEFNMQYLMKVGRLPDTQEIAAFGAFKRVNEMDHSLRSIMILRNKYRRGVMSHKFFTTKGMDQISSPEFDGTSMVAFPAGHTGDTIAIIGDTPQDIKIKTIGRMGKIKGVSAKDYWDYRIQNGEYKAIKLYAPSQSPLAGYGPIKDSHQVRFVIVKAANASDKPLDWKAQLPWRGGGHFTPKYNQYIKQINVKTENVDGQTTHYATGVNTLMPVVNGVEGRAILQHFENLRQLLSKATSENLAAARNLVENTLHMNWEEVYSMFRPVPRRGPDGRMSAGDKPLFNLSEPFQLVPVNKNLINMDREGLAKRYAGKGKFVDASVHGDESLQDAVAFSQERDFDELKTLKNEGSVENPAYSWDSAPLWDAIPMMDRALTKVSHSFMMDEVKQQAIEQWLKEAAPALKAGGATESELQASPLFWFHRGDLKPAVGIDAIRMNELETARQQIKQFVGQVSETDAITHTWSQRIADSIYERYPRLGKMIDPVWVAHQLQDPTRSLRSLTFHLKMGLGSIPQILVQGQTFTNIFGIAGLTRASQGTFATLVWQYSRVNPGIVASMDKFAVKMGWKSGEIGRALEDAKNTGFLNVGREYALRDDPMSNRFIQTAYGKFLELGALPFTEGERNVRAGAWFTAWKEYAEQTGKTTMNNVDKLNILNRASILNGNMNRASNALYQRGWAAFPTQFLTYTIRQMELMWGHRLTSMEKARLLLSNAMMYGLPVGLGISGLPSDLLRHSAIENGYTPGENYFNTLITEGVPSTIAGIVNGGQYYNIGERYGNTGLPLYDAMYGDKTLWQLALGASGSTLASIFEAFDPFRQKIMSTLRGDPAGFNIMPEHYLQVAKEATSINNTWRAIVAAKTGQLITKKGDVLSSRMDLFSSILMGVTGLQPQEASDVFLMSNISRAEKETQEWAGKRFKQEFHRALEAYDNKDPSNGDAFMTNAFAYMDMFIPDEDRAKVLSDSSDQWSDIIERVRQSFGTKNLPPWLKDAREQQYIKGIK